MARIDQGLVAQAIGLPPDKAIAYFRAKGYAITWNWQDQAEAARSQAFTVAKAARLDILQDLKGMVQKGLDDGITFQDFRRQLEPRLQAKGWWGRKVVEGPNGTEEVQLGSPHRLQTIYRTNMQGAYMAGRREAQLENADERPFLQYIALEDASTRPEHLAMNGKIFHIHDPIWARWTPPAGYNCRCRTRALNAEQAAARGGESKAPDVDPDPGFGKPPGEWKPDLREYTPEIRKAGAELEKERPGTPQGTPVSKALRLPGGKLKDALREAVAALDEVHGDGDLPPLPVLAKAVGKGAYGAYYHRSNFAAKDTPTEIRIRPTGDHPGLTLAHELGHFLDNQAMTVRSGFGSADAPELAGFRRAVRESAQVKALEGLLAKRQAEIDVGGAKRMVSIPRKHVKYLLTMHEIWARAYAQFIATRSKNPKLMRELNLLREKKPGYLNIPRQWDEADFAPIQAEIETYFKGRGWIK